MKNPIHMMMTRVLRRRVRARGSAPGSAPRPGSRRSCPARPRKNRGHPTSPPPTSPPSSRRESTLLEVPQPPRAWSRFRRSPPWKWRWVFAHGIVVYVMYSKAAMAARGKSNTHNKYTHVQTRGMQNSRTRVLLERTARVPRARLNGTRSLLQYLPPPELFS